jgi:glycosyltransferase involved in cell wall biosynthesis
VVSVIITTYNRRHFLREATTSVLSQTRRADEVIVVDDGSTDGSEETVADLPVRYVRTENGGVSSARNHGIALARGDYIAFLDVDDLWKKNKLAIQMAAMSLADSAVSYTDETWIRNGHHLNQGKRHKKYSGHIYEQCLPLCIISPSSVVIRRDVFDVVGLFDESLPVCEDYDMWLRICCRFPVLFVAESLIVKQGGHADQLSRRYDVMDSYRVRAMVKALESGALSAEQRRATVTELAKRCAVIIKGAEKRGKHDDVVSYRDLLCRYSGDAGSTAPSPPNTTDCPL